MPNWCANSVKLKPITKKAKSFFPKIVAEIDKGQECRLFNLIIPMPQQLLDTVAGSVAEDKRAEHQAQMALNTAQYGYKDWYDFANAEWGTKWEACNLTFDIEWATKRNEFGLKFEKNNGQITIWFDTAWSPPMGIYKKLEDMGFEVEATYCEQGVGYAGWYSNGTDNEHTISFWEDENSDDIRNMMHFFESKGLTHTPAHTGG